MKTITSEQAHSQLYRSFAKAGKRIPHALWEQFIAKARVDCFKAKERIHSADSLSTHSYFIISGLIMCYFEHVDVKFVKWVRAENGYAFSSDIVRFDVGRDRPTKRDCLMALEDTVVVSISHEDLEWVRANISQIALVIAKLYMYYGEIFERLETNDGQSPEDKYENIQREIDFSLDRVPDIYLASYLNISLKDLKEVKELRKNEK